MQQCVKRDLEDCSSGPVIGRSLSREKLLLIGAAYLAITVFASAIFLTPRLVGPLSREFGLSASRVGSLFSTYFGGFLISVLAGGIATDLWGRRVLLVGIGGISVSLAGFCIAPGFLWILIASFFLGTGAGLVEGPASVLISDLAGKKRGMALNLSQVCFGVGGLITPFLAGYFLYRGFNWRAIYGVIGAAAVLVTFAMSRLKFPPVSQEDDIKLSQVLRLLPQPMFLALGVGMVVYVGAEQGVASWISHLVSSQVNASEFWASMGLSLFWAAMIPGRFLSGWLSFRFSPSLMLFWCFLGSILALFVLYWAAGPVQIALASGLTGLVMAGIWPTILVVAGNVFTKNTGSIFGALIACGALGGMIFPWVVGVLAPFMGLQLAMVVVGVVLSAVGMGIFWLLGRNGVGHAD